MDKVISPFHFLCLHYNAFFLFCTEKINFRFYFITKEDFRIRMDIRKIFREENTILKNVKHVQNPRIR